MSAHDPAFDGACPSVRGGETVADLRAMDGGQALAVMLLRDLFDGPDGRERMRGVFADALGGDSAEAAMTAWTELGHLIAGGTRRPVMRHASGCRCVGSDEAVIAQVLHLAATGEREDAMLVLALLVHGDRLLPALRVAERAGSVVLRVASIWRRTMPAPPTGRRHLH